MTHNHGDTHTVIERDGGNNTAAMFVALAAILVVAIIALAVLWTQPWDDDGNGVDTSPSITDDVVPDGGSGEPDVVPDGQ